MSILDEKGSNFLPLIHIVPINGLSYFQEKSLGLVERKALEMNSRENRGPMDP